MDEILVTVICTAFNQEGYIRKALDGLLMQKTNFLYEVIVHDDASTIEHLALLESMQRSTHTL